MDILEERYSLVRGRLEQIHQENELLRDEKSRYWYYCSGLALGEKTEDLRFLDYSFCSAVFGESGRYWCLLFAQMVQVPGFYRERQAELICVCCELLVELYRIILDEEETSAIRNTLYWFYSDYSELYCGYWIDVLDHDFQRVCLGGPMLLADKKHSDAVLWKQHLGDFGLYMGNRFEERCYQAVLLKAQAGKRSACVSFAGILKICQVDLDASSISGFGTAKRQQEGLGRLAGRILETLDA